MSTVFETNEKYDQRFVKLSKMGAQDAALHLPSESILIAFRKPR